MHSSEKLCMYILNEKVLSILVYTFIPLHKVWYDTSNNYRIFESDG